MSVTFISTRQMVEASDEDVVQVISAALGGQLVNDDKGCYRMEPRPGKELGVMARLFNHLNERRRFADLRAVATIVIDMQIEQLMIYGDELKRRGSEQ